MVDVTTFTMKFFIYYFAILLLLSVSTHFSVQQHCTKQDSSKNKCAEIPKINFDQDCQSHQVNEPAVTIHVCRATTYDTFILPIFDVNVDNETDDIQTDFYFDVPYKQYDILLTSQDILQVVSQMPRYSFTKVQFFPLKQIKLVSKYDNIAYSQHECVTKLCPCFVFSQNWLPIETVENDTYINFKIIFPDKDNKCIKSLTLESLFDNVDIVTNIGNGQQLPTNLISFQSSSSATSSGGDGGSDGNSDKSDWKLVQNRVDSHLTFAQPESAYKDGFGSPDANFWIGLNKLHELTKSNSYKVRFEMQKRDDKIWYFAEYDVFIVGSENQDYKLTISGYNPLSPLDDSLTHRNKNLNLNGMKFTSKDKDRDNVPNAKNSCSKRNGFTAFWFNRCSRANPNGPVGELTDRRARNRQGYMFWHSTKPKRWNITPLAKFRIYLIPKK